MEEEIAEATHTAYEPLEQAHRFADEHPRPSSDSKADREIEEAMHLHM